MIHPSRDACDEWESAVLDVTPTHNQVALAPASSPASTDVEEAAQVLQDLCILPPPAASDTGGHYPHDHESPGPYKLPVTSTIVTDDTKQDEQLDPVLITGLENARERMTLLQFEDQIVRFLRHSREPHLHFPPLSSYHRLIVHRLAQRCGLEHQTADYSPLENSSARVVTLIKTTQSVVPRLLLIDLSTDRQSSTKTPVCAPKIMMRKRCAPRLGSHNGGGSGTDKAMPSLQDRERAYAEARARIFGAATNNTAAESVVPSLPSSSSTHDGSGIAASNGNDVARHGSRQAAGPDDSRGFGRGDAREGGDDVVSTSGSSSSKGRSNVNGMNDEYSRTVQPSAPNAASWKGSKVLWRNREQELNDPDFTRNHDAFRARSSGGAASGSGSGGDLPFYGDRFGGGVRFGHGELQERPHDRFYGYHHQQNGGAPSLHPPPLMPMVSPGRGRYHVGGPDYANNRVDINLFQRSSHQQYHPQQQQPIQLHQMNPPPSMVMGRSSYGYPSPRGRQLPPHAAGPRAVVHSEFVDGDFPPLK